MNTTERALVGAMIGDNATIPKVVNNVRSEDFTSPMAMSVYECIVEMFKSGKKVDPVTVSANCEADIIYTTSAMDDCFWSNAEDYAKEVARAGKLRRIKSVLNQLSGGDNSSEILSGITDLYNNESSGGGKKSDIKSVMERFKSHVGDNIKRGHLGLKTGIDICDEAMINYVPGHIWTIGGYTSTGKTAMMVQKIVNIFRFNKDAKVCIFATEMTEEQMIGRIIGNMSGIYSQKILSGDLYHGEVEKYENALREIESWNLEIHDDVNELSAIEATARGHHMQGGVGVVFIDYVQNCCVTGITKAYEEQKKLATSFQQLAKNINATLVCLSQVSNDVGRGNVNTFELKGAGEWAAVSDVGVMLRRGKVSDDELLYSIDKNRHGMKPDVVFKFSRNYSNLLETGESIN